jgi:isopropylmalate/homocitrate/citramalate synthase
MTLPKSVKILEVSPRDGLQNEVAIVPTEIKIEFINHLSNTGLQNIEVTSFVSPKKIPQLADNQEVFQKINKKADISYSALVPNLRGLDDAIQIGVKEIAVFGAASETFSQKNINCSIEESFNRFAEVIHKAKQHNIAIRGYLSCAAGCPYEGDIDPHKVAILAEKLFNLGCYEIAICDTIGIATPLKMTHLLQLVAEKIPLKNMAVHLHDTYGQALANIYAALQFGVSTIDCSVAGLGGCPYAKGASGNVATEDVIYMLNGLNIKHGIQLEKLIEAGQFINDYLKRNTNSKVANAIQKS